MHKTLLFSILLIAVTGCLEEKMQADASPAIDSSVVDGTVTDADIDAPHDLNELTISGHVTLQFASQATGVKVITVCGENSAETTTNDLGDYEITTDVDGCDPLIISLTKESYLPFHRRIQLPPPTSPVTLDVSMAEMTELVCGTEHCVAEGSEFNKFPPGPMSRGWVASAGGRAGLPYFGGEMVTVDGDLLWTLAFGYFDLRDETGAKMTEFPPFEECFRLTNDSLDWLVDLDPATVEKVEMKGLVFDAESSRWVKTTKDTHLSQRVYNGMSDAYIFELVPAAALPDVRSGQYPEQLWVCTQVGGSGWIAIGNTVSERSCIVINTKYNCQPTGNSVVQATGRDHGYRVENWTDRQGNTCVNVAQSEPVGSDFDDDQLAGETFFLDISVRNGFGNRSIESFEASRTPGHCGEPDNCEKINIYFGNDNCDE